MHEFSIIQFPPFFFTTICDFCVHNCFFSKPLINKTKIYTSAYTYNNNKQTKKIECTDSQSIKKTPLKKLLKSDFAI